MKFKFYIPVDMNKMYVATYYTFMYGSNIYSFMVLGGCFRGNESGYTVECIKI